MSDISLINIEELTSTSSTDKDILIPIALPSGGGSYVIRHLSKIDIFRLSDQEIDFVVAGATDILTFSAAGGGKLVYFGISPTTSTSMWTTIEHGVGDGTDYAASLRRSGTTGTLMLRDSDGTSEFTKMSLTQSFKEATLNNASTVTADKAQRSFLKVLPNSGTIAAGDIQFPQSPSDNDSFKFYVDGTITTLSLVTAPGSETIDETLTTITNSWAEYAYRESDTEWKLVSIQSSGGGAVDSVTGTSDEIIVSEASPDPVLSLATAVTDSLALADSAVQNRTESGGAITGTTSTDLDDGSKTVFYEATGDCTVSGSNLGTAIPGTVIKFVIYASGANRDITFNNSQFSKADFTTPIYTITSTTILVVEFTVYEGTDVGLGAGNSCMLTSDNT